MHRVRQLGDLLAAGIGAILALLIGLIVVAIFAQVFWRYVLGAPLLWPEEIARHSLIWTSFLGFPILLRRGELIAIQGLAERLPARLRGGLALVVQLAAVPLLVVLVWQGLRMMAVVQGQVSPATGLPGAWLYLSAPVGGALGLFYVVESLLVVQSEGDDGGPG